MKSNHQLEGVLNQQPIMVTISHRAQMMLVQNPASLVVEMELRYQCMVRKLLHFHSQVPQDMDVFWVTPKLGLYFHAVIGTGACSISDHLLANGRAAPKTQGLSPSSLFLDWRKGQWEGRYSLSAPMSGAR